MKSAIRTDKAPRPAAAYEQAVTSGDMIFVSGQVASNPTTGSIDATSIEEQVTQALRNIEAIVEAAGASKSDIVRCGVFLGDLNDFAAMNLAYKEFFGDDLPARTTVQAGLGTLRVEIDAIAVRSRVRRRRRTVKPKRPARVKPRKRP
jgi:2-iminobutanoate/2-iminopropanoate deaminase